jgi:hypothetical protein
MHVEKKVYISPGIESERLDLPQAWSCDVHLSNTSAWYYGDNYLFQTPTFDC